ncbi:MAG TPA: type II toxin-antitoxin system RelE/ParE family toxin [Candidatus Nanoarchaeia archaeon]
MYKIFLSSTADHQLRRLDYQQRQRILQAIKKLSNNPRPEGKLVKKLVGKDGYRLRVGNLRILYTINDRISLVFIYEVGKRGDIY